MRKVQYKAKNGNLQWKPSFSWIESVQRRDEYEGFCLACGSTQDGVEPDARRYHCESCGANKVYGAEELAMMGLFCGTIERIGRNFFAQFYPQLIHKDNHIMIAQDFVSKDGTHRFVNGGRVRLNGRPARQWDYYTRGEKSWIYQTTRFLPLRATRADIENSF